MPSPRRPSALLLAGLLVLVVAALGAAATSGAAAVRTADDPLGARVDGYVEDYLARHRLPGASVAVVRDGETVHLGGYGEDGADEVVTPRTRFRVASVSKSFTAEVVRDLAEAGRLDLDAPVVDALPELALDDPRTSSITVRQLLDHTSGIVVPTIIGPADDLRAGVARLRDWSLASDPGTTYRYSNANYWLLARLVEVVTGEPFDEALRRDVLEPLGMTRTSGVVTSREAVDGLAPGHVTAYGLSFAAPEPEQMVDGAGGVVSTAEDMGRWLAHQQRAGVSVESLDGAGWQQLTEDPDRVGTSGVDVTANAQQVLDTGSGYGVAVLLASSSIVREHAFALADGVLEITEGGSPAPGAPVGVLVDAVLGLLTVLTLGLGVLGVRRAGVWAGSRRHRPAWRLALRLLPQLVAPALAVLLLGVAPSVQDNSLTPLDVVRLFPALVVLVTAAGLVSAAVTSARALAWARVR